MPVERTAAAEGNGEHTESEGEERSIEQGTFHQVIGTAWNLGGNGSLGSDDVTAEPFPWESKFQFGPELCRAGLRVLSPISAPASPAKRRSPL